MITCEEKIIEMQGLLFLICKLYVIIPWEEDKLITLMFTIVHFSFSGYCVRIFLILFYTLTEKWPFLVVLSGKVNINDSLWNIVVMCSCLGKAGFFWCISTHIVSMKM